MNNLDYHGNIESGICMDDISLQISNLFPFEIQPLSSTNPNAISSMKGMHQVHESKSSKQDLHKRVTILLQECLQNRTKDKITEAIEIIHENGLTGFGHLGRCFVYYSYSLYLYLQVHQNQQVPIDDEDLGSMIARCIEYSPGKWLDQNSEGLFAQESLQHLLDYKGDRELEIKLLPKRDSVSSVEDAPNLLPKSSQRTDEFSSLSRSYSINPFLYDFAKRHGVRDRYYDAFLNQSKLEYEYPDIVTKERTSQYTGYRDAYHLLLYGSANHLQSLIVRWDLWGDDCTTDAARDFFELPKECSIDVVKCRVNQLSTQR
jgi:hypothetical protein